MVTVTIEITAQVADHDRDVLRIVPDAILDRFAGTALHIRCVTVTKVP